MHFDNQAISSGCNAGHGHFGNQIRVTGPMRRINDDGQVSLLMEIDDGRKRQCETGVRLKGTNPALAKHNICIAFIENVFGRQEQFIERGTGPSFQ